MNTYERKPNTGSAFLNDKEGNEKRPDYKGTVNIEGKDHYVAIWNRTSKGGKQYVYLAFEDKDKKDREYRSFGSESEQQEQASTPF